MSKIKKLDNLTIQKIAAGEVIERPSSIVKELVENSLDANSTNIVIEIQKGGKDLIRVTDNGDGMSKEDLPKAFMTHSTSKLSKIDDLYSIMSLGFRGEALPSISSVSKVQVLTKTKGSQGGIQSEFENGKLVSMRTIGCPKGTTIIVRDLFYNLPVRKKFLKSDVTEGNHISDIVYKLALGNPNVSFSFIRDSKTIFKTSSNRNLEDNIYTLLGKETSNNLISIEYSNESLSLEGFISNNKLYRGNRAHQYIYINGRYISNYTISKIIENQYQSLIPINRFPIFILYINMHPGDIDVNIHPSKQEIKFVNGDMVYESIGHAVKKHLEKSFKIPRIEFSKEKKEDVQDLPLLFDLAKTKEETKATIGHSKEDKFKGFIVKDLTEEDFSWDSDFDESDSINTDDLITEDLSNSKKENHILDFDLTNIIPVGTVFQTYIIAENRVEDKLFFIDQHAAHERIMYERYKKEFENEDINTQQLLYPEIFELTNKENNIITENIKLFNDLGFEIEEFGPNSVAIRSVPMLFGVPNPRKLFLDILDNVSDVKNIYDTMPEKIIKIACTNAVKSGDTLDQIEIMELFKDLQSCDNPYTCPHGRPVLFEMTKNYIEKQFLRIN